MAARGDALDIAELWATMREHAFFIVGVAALTFALVMLATFGSRMQFRSVGRLYLGELEENASAATGRNEVAISAANQGGIGSEVEIIQSRSLVSRAILDSGLNVTITAAGSPIPRYGSWLFAGRDPARLDIGGAQLGARQTALSNDYGEARSYRVHFTSLTEYDLFAGGRRLGGGRLEEALKVGELSLTLLPGERSLKPGLDFDVTVRPLPDVLDAALKKISVYAPKPLPPALPVNVVTVEFSASSPRVAARFIDCLMAAYLSQRQSWKAEDATAAESFVTNQLQKTRESLDDFEKKLADYRSSNRVVVTDNEAKAMIEQIGKYEEQRVAARLEVSGLTQLQGTLRSSNPPVGALLLGGTTDTVIERMAASLAEARQRLTDLDSRFNAAAPDVRAQKEQIEAQLQAIRNYVGNRAERARGNLSSLDNIIKQFEDKLNTVPGAQVGLAQLSRQSDVYDRMYTYLLERQQQTAIIKASTLSKNRVLDAPESSFREDSPKLLLRLLSAPLGLLMGALLVLARSLFAKTFQSEADVRSAFGGVPIVVSVPRRGKLKPRRAIGKLSNALNAAALADDEETSFGEAFRMLRTRYYRMGRGNAGQALLVTSPNPGDGKTLCATALAESLSADGKRVLLVDADLRRKPSGSRPTAEAVSLREVLGSGASLPELMPSMEGGKGRFFTLPSGAPAASELLSSPAMARFLADAKAQFDFCIFDAPSFPRAADALVLAGAVDTVISVFRLHNTERRLANDHLNSLSTAATSYGVVLNEVGTSEVLSSGPVRKAFDPREHGQSAPSWWRNRSVWWLAGVLLLACAAALLSHQASASPFRIQAPGVR